MIESTQIYIVSILQIILALGLINVWLVRFNTHTQYRGKGAMNMKDEFSAYGLPAWSVYVVGAVKLAVTVALIAGLWLPFLVYPAAVVLVMLMLGAVSMHIKVHDPFIRAVPALLMLLMSVAVVVLI
jgi:uncharacterized membrane protein YphA (DoxX/SURF4 family)